MDEEWLINEGFLDEDVGMRENVHIFSWHLAFLIENTYNSACSTFHSLLWHSVIPTSQAPELHTATGWSNLLQPSQGDPKLNPKLFSIILLILLFIIIYLFLCFFAQVKINFIAGSNQYRTNLE